MPELPFLKRLMSSFGSGRAGRRAVLLGAAAQFLTVGALAGTRRQAAPADDTADARRLAARPASGDAVLCLDESGAECWREAGGIRIAAAAGDTPRPLANRAADIVNVLDFGADPTGAKDSIEAFKAAYAAARGGTIQIPVGTYVVSDVVPLNAAGTRWLGASQWRTVIQPVPGTRARCVFGHAAPADGSTSYVEISDLAIKLGGQDIAAVDLVSVGKSTVRRLYIEGGSDLNRASGIGIHLHGDARYSSSYDNVIENCTVNYCRSGIRLGRHCNAQMVLGGNFVSNVAGIDGYQGDVAPSTQDAPKGNVLIGCRVEGCRYGVREQGQQNTYQGVWFESCEVADLDFLPGARTVLILNCNHGKSKAAMRNKTAVSGLYVLSPDTSGILLSAPSRSSPGVISGNLMLTDLEVDASQVKAPKNAGLYLHKRPMALSDSEWLLWHDDAAGDGKGKGGIRGLQCRGETMVLGKDIRSVELGARTAVEPGSDGACALGSAGRKWRQIHAASGTIVSSDRREKARIRDETLGLGFISRLRPVEFVYRDGGERDAAGNVVPGRRVHHGFVAQDVKRLLDDLGVDHAMWVEERGTGEAGRPAAAALQGLRYHELISSLVKAVQELKGELDALKTSVGKG
jgi:hypothetical protein